GLVGWRIPRPPYRLCSLPGRNTVGLVSHDYTRQTRPATSPIMPTEGSCRCCVSASLTTPVFVPHNFVERALVAGGMNFLVDRARSFVLDPHDERHVKTPGQINPVK